MNGLQSPIPRPLPCFISGSPLKLRCFRDICSSFAHNTRVPSIHTRSLDSHKNRIITDYHTLVFVFALLDKTVANSSTALYLENCANAC